MPFQPFADGRLPLDEVAAANDRLPIVDEQGDRVVCGDQGTEYFPVTPWFDPEADRYVGAHDDCAEGEGYRLSA